MTTAPAASDSSRVLYMFLDEGGNFDFSAQGTRYFLITSLTRERPLHACKELVDLKYDVIESGTDVEYFHAAEDRQAVRNAVFPIIVKHLDGSRIDSVIVEKRKTGPALQSIEKFYPKILGYLVEYVLRKYVLSRYKEVIIFTDSIPVNRHKKAVEKSVKNALAASLPAGTRFRVFHHSSKSNFDLQIADYCNWAIYRKWNDNDRRSYDLIQKAVRSEFDIFQHGTRHYY